MSNRSNYRVKVDLTKYHQDARRFSWIYIDSTYVWFISHVKQHITNIFGTEEPFHLLLNGKEYLPANEDARVIKENELILVEPGTGISSANDKTISSPGKCHSSINRKVQPTDNKNTNNHIDKCDMLIELDRNSNKTVNDSVTDVSAMDVTTYHSIWEKTEVENCSTTDPDNASNHKRKRIRRKRSKQSVDESLTETKDHKQQQIYRNPKSLHLPAIPTGKHIHFDDRVSVALDNGANETTGENEKQKSTLLTPPKLAIKARVELSTLLGLRQTSTPVMFVNKKLKHTSENSLENNTMNCDYNMEKCSNLNDAQINQNVESNGNNNVNELTEITSDYSNVDPEKYPSLENITEINDVIAFKILKIGKEYTPEVSDYIIAKTINWCPKKLLFTFEILSGQMHIQMPLGKFSLPTDESEHQICDTANFNFSQLIDPRLIYRKCN